MEVSRSGIPYLPDDDRAGPPELVDAIRARRPGGTLLHLDRMLLHSHELARGWNGLLGAVRARFELAPRLRELAVMAIAVLNRASYEWAHHQVEFLGVGGTPEQMEALRDVAAAVKDQALFDEMERATLALTLEMTRDVAVSDATMKRVRALLPDRQVVELVGTIAVYNMVSRFLAATGIEVE
ncbi:MAG TPA: carboxymuconolactone decarboxylase family protein [Anaeromyxobacteraceae bacterium]|nr:carboxymuconolactone decarboxylase family protein [Anaeromyxobacteraceae bacterium]